MTTFLLLLGLLTQSSTAPHATSARVIYVLANGGNLALVAPDHNIYPVQT